MNTIFSLNKTKAHIMQNFKETAYVKAKETLGSFNLW
jgi:hypothetical protein